MLFTLVPNKYKKWCTLFGGFLIQISLGLFMTFGNMLPYLTSYLRVYKQIDIRYTQTVWIATLYGISFSLSNLLCGLLTSTFKIRPKINILFGGLILTTSLFLTFLTIKTSFFLIILTFGILFGFGSGFAYVAPLSIAMKWFPKNSGFSTSTILLGYGLSSVFLNPIETVYINPNNLSPDLPYSLEYPDEKYFSNKELLERVPRIFIILGVITAGLQLIGLSLLAEKTGRLELEIVNEIEEETESLIEPVKNEQINSLGIQYENPNDGLTLNQAIKTPIFWIFFLKIFTQMVPCGLIVNFYKTYGQTFIADDKFLSLIGSMASIFNGMGTFLWGFLIDRFPYKICFLILSTLLVSISSTIYLVQYLNVNIVYGIYVGLVNLCQSGIYVLMPTTFVKTFGAKNFQAIYGALFMSTLLSSFVVAELGSQSVNFGWAWLFLTSGFIALF
ncbi:unnamed protein product, partial [Brachionus calyciflorus]